jgi:hypothetical protein
MASFAIFAIVLYCVASLFVGFRLLLLARRTRQLPELLAAITMLGIGPFGFGLTVTSSLLISHSTLVANLLWAVAAIALNVGSATGYAFSYRVFYPSDTRVRGMIKIVTLTLALLWLAEGWLTGFEAAEPASVATRAADWLRGGALLWGGFESLRYWTLLRRRIQIGLASPIVARRFLLWGCALVGGGLSNCIDATTKLFVAHALDYPLLSLTNSLAGLTSAICLLFAFWPNQGEAMRDDAEPVLDGSGDE